LSKVLPISDPSVARAFEAYTPAVRKRLMAVRRMILGVAARTAGVGKIQETLKWGEPSYLTLAPKSGTTIRIHKRPEDNFIKLCVHCQTSLIPDIREIYPSSFHGFDGNRCILLDLATALPKAELEHFIAMALTYHLKK